MSAWCVVFPATASADWTSTAVFIDSPEAGENFGTHDLIRVRWHSWVDWGYFDDPPDPETIYYWVTLNDGVLMQGTYDYIDVHNIWGEVTGSVDYRVPGNGNSKNPNSPLVVCTSKCPFPGCDPLLPGDEACATIFIGVKTWYDPLPRPQLQSRAEDGEPTATPTSWGTLKARYE
jgi:hypothetical protein